MGARFFGNPESPLFGVYHAARGKATKKGAQSSEPIRAAIICPPIGQEYIRTHWCLRLLANQLARKGIHVLRLDYHGLGDSFANPEQIKSLSDWQNDIAEAIQHLQSTTGAETVMLIGQRMGGTLAGQVAQTNNQVNSLVLWEPICDGQVYLDELREMHAEMLDLWVCKMSSPNNAEVEEILGFQFHREMLNDIANTQLDLASIVQPLLIIDRPSNHQFYGHPDPSMLKLIDTDNDGNWYDMRVLETAMLRPQETRTIVKLVDDMFKRLQEFGALTRVQFPSIIASDVPTVATSTTQGVSL